MPIKRKIRITRNTKINGQPARVGDEIEVDEIDFNTLTHFGKAVEITDITAGGGPVPDERETELKARLSKRGRLPKPAPSFFDDADNGEEG